MAKTLRVRFEPSGVQLDIPGGERVLDAVDEHPVLGLPTACRAGNCGACLVRVRAGMSALVEPTALERRTLIELGAGAGQRLGCQLRVAVDFEPGPAGCVVLEIVRC